MKRFAAFAAAFLLLVSASQAVDWYVVTVSIVVNQGGNTITKTTLNAKKYLEEGARRNGDPDLKKYFIGFRADTGQVAVVFLPTESVAYTVCGAPTNQGTAANGTNLLGTIAGNATVSSLNTDMTGFVYDKFTRKTDGSLKSVSRTVFAGSGNQTITGTIRTTAKKFTL